MARAARQADPHADEEYEHGDVSLNSEIKPVSKSGDTLVIGCKIPNGIILPLGDLHDTKVPLMGGGYDVVKLFRPDGRTIVLYGPARAAGSDAKAPITKGAAKTYGVPRDYWEKWLADNQGSPLIVNKQIFVAEDEDSLNDMAADFKAFRSGMEPLKIVGDPRTPKPSSPHLSEIKKLDMDD